MVRFGAIPYQYEVTEVYPPEAFWIMIWSMLGSGLWIVHEVLAGGSEVLHAYSPTSLPSANAALKPW